MAMKIKSFLQQQVSRRQAITGVAALAGSMMLLKQKLVEAEASIVSNVSASDTDRQLAPGIAGKDYQPVVIPNGWALPYKIGLFVD